jgi:ATP-dependent Clp protease, protease subunit
MAGDEIVMRAGAMLMIHDPAAVTIGPAEAHRKSADNLDRLGDRAAEIYAARRARSDRIRHRP